MSEMADFKGFYCTRIEAFVLIGGTVVLAVEIAIMAIMIVEFAWDCCTHYVSLLAASAHSYCRTPKFIPPQPRPAEMRLRRQCSYSCQGCGCQTPLLPDLRPG